jgi:hypothetical protein
MIIRIFRSGISKGESPVNYLLNNIDHSGNERAVKPELLEGNPQTTIDVINSIQRKYKYISGCISFRDSEKPTKAQLYDVIDDFKKTFCPGLNGDNYNSLFVLHKDKTNTEVHFIFANQELKSMRRFNIHFPGKQNIAFFESFVKVSNQKLGYAQVIPDPIKIAFTDFERKTPEGREDKSNKRWIQQSIIKEVTKGNIKNRADLCKHLDENLGITITRQGKDYLSVKLPGALKAKRLRGPLYSEDADYQSLITQSIASKQPYYLSPTEFKTEQTKLDSFIHSREQFNIKAYLTPRPVRRLAKQVQPKSTITRRTTMAKTDYLPIMKKLILEALIATRTKLAPLNTVNKMPNIKTTMSNMANIRRKAIGGKTTPAGLNLDGIKITVSELETSLHEAIGEMNAAKGPIEVARLKQRVIQLQMQIEKLHIEMMAMQIKYGSNINRPKPK